MIKKESFNIDIIYEDNFIVVIDKPHGILVVEDRYDKELPTLKRFLQERYGDIFVVHRLDYGTGGVMVFAKDKYSHRNLNSQFENGLVNKEYLAIVKGNNFKPLTVMLPIAAKNSHGKYKINFKSGKKAITSFLVERELKGMTLIKAIPKTGRTHQIRVHLKAVKFPLLRDFLYNEKIEDKRLTLMCSKISFLHPKTKKKMEFSLPISDFLKSYLV